MIGNDIVDLELAARQSNWRRDRWMQKIFTQSEQEIISKAGNPTSEIWKFWSMKEATYKAHQRRFLLPRSFNPKSFECSHQKVRIDTYLYTTSTELNKDFIHTIACASTDALRNYQIHLVDKQKYSINKILKATVASHMNLEISNINIQKGAQGIPWFLADGKTIDIPFSITNHGRFSAFILKK